MNLKLVDDKKNMMILKSTNKTQKQLSTKQKNYVKNLATKMGFAVMKDMKVRGIKIKKPTKK